MNEQCTVRLFHYPQEIAQWFATKGVVPRGVLTLPNRRDPSFGESLHADVASLFQALATFERPSLPVATTIDDSVCAENEIAAALLTSRREERGSFAPRIRVP